MLLHPSCSSSTKLGIQYRYFGRGRGVVSTARSYNHRAQKEGRRGRTRKEKGRKRREEEMEQGGRKRNQRKRKQNVPLIQNFFSQADIDPQ